MLYRDKLLLNFSLVFAYAETLPKGDWHSYEKCKKLMHDTATTAAAYEIAIKTVTDILEV